MNLTRLRADIQDIAFQISGYDTRSWSWYYANQRQFAELPLLTIESLPRYLDCLFHSDVTHRLWSREGYRPAQMMRQLADACSDQVVTSLRDLWDESRDVEGRIDRFKYYMESAMTELRSQQPLIQDSYHHQDNSIISYYLSIAHPPSYAFYQPALHRLFIERYHAKSIPPGEHPTAYQKLVAILHRFFIESKDIEPWYSSQGFYRIGSPPRQSTVQLLTQYLSSPCW